MKRKMTIVIAALTGAVLIGGLSLLARRGRAAAPAPAEVVASGGDEARIAQLKEQLASLGLKVSALEHGRPADIAGRQAATAPSEAPKREPSSYTPEERKKIIAEDEARRRKYLDEVEQKFRVEARDDAWAGPAEGSIRTLAATVAKSTEKTIALSGAECRREMCRVVVMNDDDSLREWFPHFGIEAQQGFANILVDRGQDPSGRPISIFYMSRRRTVQN